MDKELALNFIFLYIRKPELMYLNHFNLKKLPFENILDSEFFFNSEIHEEAYSRMSFVIEQKKSAGLLSGGYGTGKTFILKKLEKDLTRKGYIFSVINNPRVDDLGLLRMILHNFIGYKVPNQKADVLMAIEKFFKETYKDGKHCVVLIDEAHDIDSENIFEELRLLLNYQNENRNLLTLILSGQDEICEKIHSNKQFSQRVFLNYKLRPLTLEETKNYIAHRLKVSGSEKQLFSDEVLSLIYDRTGGIPRRINNICNLALLEAFSANKDAVDEECVNEALNTQGE